MLIPYLTITCFNVIVISSLSFPVNCIGNLRQSWILDPTWWIPEYSTGFQSLWIPVVKWDSGFLKLYSGFQSPGFWIFPQAKVFPVSGFPYMECTFSFLLTASESHLPFWVNNINRSENFQQKFWKEMDYFWTFRFRHFLFWNFNNLRWDSS